MTIKLDDIKKIKGVKDCAGLIEGTRVKFAGKVLFYAGITTDSQSGQITHRMICNEGGELIEYELNQFEAWRGKVSPENPLYYPYKEMLEATQ
ncbi:MAG: hypothetical protein AABW47_04895 [Nanoarchaeota archaeon]